MESEKGTINKYEWKSIAKGAMVALAGALAVYVAATLEAIDWSTVGQYGFILSSLASVLINVLRKYAEGK